MTERLTLASLVFCCALAIWPAAHLNVDAKHFLIRVSTAILALATILGAAKSGVFRLPSLPVLVLSALYLLLVIGLGFAAPRTDWTVVTDTGVILVFFLCALSLTREEAHVRKLMTVWVCASIVICLYYWLQYAGIDPAGGFNPGHNLFGSLFGNRNFMAFYLVVTFPFALYAALGSTRLGRGLHLSVAALIAATLALAGGLAGISTLLLSIPVYIWYLRRVQTPDAQLFLRFLLPIYSIVVLGVILALTHRFDSPNLSGMDAFFHGRLGIWRDTLPLIADRFWVGHGPGTFPRVFPDFRSTELGFAFGFYEPIFSSHNVLLDMLAEMGILGACLFLALVTVGSGLLAVDKEVLARNRDRAFFSGMALFGCGIFSLTGEIHHVMFCTLFSWLALAIFHNSVSGKYREVKVPLRWRHVSLSAGLVVVPVAIAASVHFGEWFTASLEVKRARDTIAGGSNPLKAMKPLKRALELEPGNLFARYQLGYLEMWRGRPREALEHYHAISRVHPHFENLPYNMGLAWLGVGEPRKAVEAFSVTCRIYPTFRRAKEGMSLAYRELGMADSAQAWSQRAAMTLP